MATMKTISAALNLIDDKKENLRKAFEDLQSHSSSLSSFTLKWSDLDSHFTSLQSSLQHKFHLLQTLEPQIQSQPTKPSRKQLQLSSPATNSSESVPVRPELKSFCEKMDGLGLRRYMVDRPKERNEIRVELVGAFRYAPDAAVMVLDAMEGFHALNSKGYKDLELAFVRRSCVILLEVLMELKVEMGPEVRERAMELAVDWKRKMNLNEENSLEAIGFLQLVATYGLVYGFNMDELIDCVVILTKYKQAFDLCRVINFGDKISDLINKLMSRGKEILAVKFICEFEMTDKFPPIPILKAFAKKSKGLAQKIRKSGMHSRQSLHDATMKEVSALRSVMKCIEDYKLESEYKNLVVRRIEQLGKEKANRKRLAAAPAPISQQQSNQQMQSTSKRPRTTALAGPATIPINVAASSALSPRQQPHLQTAVLLPDHTAPYLSLAAGHYGLEGSTPAVAQYMGSSASRNGLSSVPLGFPGNLTPTELNLYHSESHMPSAYYGGYSLPPQYHPAYYPQ